MGSLAIVVILAAAAPVLAFDLSSSSVPPDEILPGGPPRDGIPAIHEPRFVEAGEAGFLDPDDRVLGVVIGGIAKAYPIRILDWHEVVNDEAGDQPFAVTWCPLTGSGIVFDRRSGEDVVSFGVSGRLYQSNVLLYDRETESLWSQLGGEALTGERRGTPLGELPSLTTSWAHWRELHPGTLVLSTETGHRRPYGRSAYSEYRTSAGVMFPVGRLDRRRKPKEEVLGLDRNGRTVAFPLAELAKRKTPLHVPFGDESVEIRYDASTRTAAARVDGEIVPSFVGYWFAWQAFHPGTELWPFAAAAGPGEPVPEGVVILEQEGGWADMAGIAPVGLETDPGAFFLISGTLRNRTDQPVPWVRLEFELLDAAGETLVRETGFNRKAELLRPAGGDGVPEDPAPAPEVEPLGPGEEDRFRMFFFRDETPEFGSYRVRVIGIGTTDGASSDGKP